ncbi:zona pellucida sperm-binding protein 3-like [Lampris incognitus]|uniref:zona pellucida sperm-binding protein 3-like n=1 Tax=Lampris incognitus TaxID=2546036 RepID=UPI0024B5C776|nr:zona pellucida sperm-binding protein 3-like [Lampris incognitus]
MAALVKFEERVPLPADSVAVQCDERVVTVEVDQNLLGNGQLANPSDVTLGGCAALDMTDNVLVFQTELQDCGSTMAMTDEVLVYTFFLSYVPTPIRQTLIVKTNPATVVIECHYPRRQFVSSSAVRPTWKTYASNKLAEQQLRFSLRLMTDDWQSERSYNVYFLSEMMHIEASVLQTHHIPLRVYIDSCVATSDPDPNSQPSYTFINNHGCLIDAKATGSKSYFMQRANENELQLQLKAFRFHQDHDDSLYITCHLKATSVSVPIDSEHKACSFLIEANRWVASGGDNAVCSCCDSSCGGQRRRRRSLAAHTDVKWEGEVALGPILVQHKDLEERLLLPEVPPEPASLVQTSTAAASPSIALLCGAGAALGLVLLGVISTFIYRRFYKQSARGVGGKTPAIYYHLQGNESIDYLSALASWYILRGVF